MVEHQRSCNASIYFTVDLEDFSYDLCRSLGSSRIPSLRNRSLHKSYLNIIELLTSNDQYGSKITFFCTGVMADRYPELIRLIAKHGHEVACHGNFHDDINGMTPKEVLKSLQKAKEKLSDVSQTEVKGFRAPRFSVDKYDFERLEAISRVFKYDSSLHFSSDTEFTAWKNECPINLVEFPVPIQKIISSNFMVKTGGSYLKLFPAYIVRKAIWKSIESGVTPIVYLHPYDIFYGFDMLARWSELEGVPLRWYWYLRQIQWGGAFNWSQKQKLHSIFSEFKSLGRLDNCLAENQSNN